MAYIGEGGVKQLAVLINNRYITADAVDTKISDAVKDIAGFKTEVVASLPTTGVEGTIYFAPSSNAEDGNSYDEFIWIASQTKFEQVGSTKVDLDDYAKTEDIPTKVSELTNDSGFLTQHQSLEGYAKTDDLYDPDNKDTLAKLSTSDDGTLLFDGSEIKGGGDTVEVTQKLKDGTEIGSIKVGDETTVLYAPEGGSGGSTEVENMYINIDRYTEDEIVIGEYMGKPLYRKTLVYNSTIPASSTAFSIGSISNIDRCVSLSGCVQHNHGTIFSIPCGHPLGNQYDVIPVISDGAVGITTGSSRTLTYTKIDVEYTKTTDPENSFDKNSVLSTVKAHGVGYENYSEEEIVVGRYIDGKPVYRKVIISEVGLVTGTNMIGSLNTSVDTVVNIAAFTTNSSGSTTYSLNANNDTSNFGVGVVKASGDVNVYMKSDWRAGQVVSFIEYTKTTDAPNSFKPEMITSGIMADEPASDAEVDEIFN